MTLTITQTPYVLRETNTVSGRTYVDSIYMLKVSGRSPGIETDLRIGDEYIDLVWHDSDQPRRPLYGTAYIELFTMSSFYHESPDIIFYSPPPRRRSRIRGADYDEVDIGYLDPTEVDKIENPCIERRMNYEAIRTKSISVSFAGTGNLEDLTVPFTSTIQDIVRTAQVYDEPEFETQSYMLEE